MHVHRSIMLAMLALTSLCAPFVHAQREANAEAAALFERMINAHRTVEVFETTCTLTISLSQEALGSEGDPVSARFVRLKNGDGVIEVGGYTIFVNGDQLYAIHASNEEEFFRHEITDFVHSTLIYECFGAFDRIPFPHLAILWGSDIMEEVYMEMYIDTWDLVPSGLVDRLVDGESVRTLHLTGEFSKMAIDLDTESNVVKRIEHTITGGLTVRQGATKTLVYEFAYPTAAQATTADAVQFAEGDRQFVGRMTDLEIEEITADAPAAGGEGEWVGKPAPGFLLGTLDGELVDLNKQRGSVVVIDFWAVWCPPCREALPELHAVAAWAKEQNMPVQVYAINTFENGADLEAKVKTVREFWSDHNYTLTVLMDADSAVAGEYGVTGIPATFVISPDGTVVGQHSGFGPDYRDSLQREISKALELLP